MGFELKGDFLKNTAEMAKKFPAAAARGLYVAGEHILGESNKIVPFENGDFMRTGTVSVDTDTMQVTISYRDHAFRGQAAWLHENTKVRHDPGRVAKFLELAFARERKTAIRIIQSTIKAEAM